jgi:hypothetical protein
MEQLSQDGEQGRQEIKLELNYCFTRTTVLQRCCINRWAFVHTGGKLITTVVVTRGTFIAEINDTGD